MIYQLNNEYYVRSLKASDLEGPYASWFEDQEVTRFNSHGKFFKNQEYFRNYYLNLNSDDKVVWAICHSKDGHIGNISLQSISGINRNAELAIIIGDKRHWGKSVGIKAGEILLYHGFFKLNLEKIFCGTAADNAGMRKMAEKLGMQLEGVRKSHLFLNGNWTDLLEYGILRKDYVVPTHLQSNL